MRSLTGDGCGGACGGRTLGRVSEQREEAQIAASTPLAIDELARLQHAEPVRDAQELTADIWESDEELEAFLADLRSSRDASLG